MAILFKNKAPYILSCALLSSAVLLSTGCSNEGSDDASEKGEAASLLEKTTAAGTSVVDSTKSAVEETADKAAAVASDAKEVVVDTADKVAAVASDAKEVVVDTADKAAAVASDAKEAVVDTADKAAAVVSNAKDAVAEKTEVVKQAVVAEDKSHGHDHASPAVDGAKVFASCAGCHGSKAEGGVGPNLNAQTASDVADKLTRYKAGEQIGPMSGMMTPIAKGLSDADIKAVSEYVVTLK
ncbi:hypothetical protein MNBD_GAMMA04-150 [hydrothermal vent metagenome]|uniref:Cytochrome c domain-containing protein n=1 Tax=hydrothermal vent metagenome TaxID=652676 RepID=A0A3B0VQP5_9ZZZZ